MVLRSLRPVTRVEKLLVEKVMGRSLKRLLKPDTWNPKTETSHLKPATVSQFEPLSQKSELLSKARFFAS